MRTVKRKGNRSDGCCQCKRKMPDGKYKVFYGSTFTEAENKYRDTLQSWEETHKKKPRASAVTYKEAAEAYEAYITSPSKPVKRGTVASYRKHLNPTKIFFGDELMEDIDAQRVRDYLDHLSAEGKAKKTALNARSVISCVFSYWCNYMHGTGNPVRTAALPKKMPVTERKEPTREQQELIEAHPEGCGFWAALFEYTGMRIGEANGLRWQDVDLAAGTITPMQAMPWYKNQPYKEKLKTENAYRSIPILSPLRPLLEAGKAAHRPEDYVMSGADTPLTQCQYRRRWVVYCRQLGLCESYMAKYKVPATSLTPAHTAERLEYKPLVTAHQFRHLFATNLFYAGVPDMVAQRLLGHADIMTTRRVYQHIREAEDAKYTAQLDAYVSGVH